MSLETEFFRTSLSSNSQQQQATAGGMYAAPTELAGDIYAVLAELTGGKNAAPTADLIEIRFIQQIATYSELDR